MMRGPGTRIISLLLAALILLLSGCGKAAGETAADSGGETAKETPAPSPAASEPPEQTPLPTAAATQAPALKADYLNYKFAYSISSESQGDRFTETVKGECAEVFSRDEGDLDVAQRCLEWVYAGDPPADYSIGAVFLVWSADICGLIDAGTLPRSTNLDEIYTHLTEVNEFPTSPLIQATQFGGGEYSVESGDILFWFDGEGAAVNAGLVILAQGGRVTVAVCSADSKVASFALDNLDKGESVVTDCTVVHMTYTCNEQLAFLFLVNEMDFNIAVACGVLANIYCESFFEPNVEEHDFSEGYGICQWTGGRRASFELWCSAKGLDHSKLRSQLLYIQYELENDVCGDLNWRLRRCGNTEEDAYTVGKLWCEMYENPKGSDDIADKRGEFARDGFFPAYRGHPYM